MQTTARYYGDIYHASGVVREVRNWFLRRGLARRAERETLFVRGVDWLYDGIKVPDRAPR